MSKLKDKLDEWLAENAIGEVGRDTFTGSAFDNILQIVSSDSSEVAELLCRLWRDTYDVRNYIGQVENSVGIQIDKKLEQFYDRLVDEIRPH